MFLGREHFMIGILHFKRGPEDGWPKLLHVWPAGQGRRIPMFAQDSFASHRFPSRSGFVLVSTLAGVGQVPVTADEPQCRRCSSPYHALQDLPRQADAICDRGVDAGRRRTDVVTSQSYGCDYRCRYYDGAGKAVLIPSFLLFAGDRPLHLAHSLPPARRDLARKSCDRLP